MNHFIPKPYRKERVTLRVDADTLARIDRLVLHYGLNRSQLINRCIDYSLAYIPDAEFTPEEDAPAEE
jgi:hypothetical protein